MTKKIKDKNTQDEKRLIELEAKLLEQEHRPFKLIWNFWNREKFKDENDIRKKAVTKALFYRLIFSPTTLALTGTGIISIMTIYFLYRQTNLFEFQNELLESQNVLTNSQNSLVKLQNSNLEKQTLLFEESSRQSFYMSMLDQLFKDINIETKTNDKLSKTLTERIIWLSRTIKPYRYLDGDSTKIHPISPEKGYLLMALVGNGINPEFLNDKVLSKANFDYADLEYADLKGLNLKNISLKYANLRYAKLQQTDFSFAKLNSATFHGSKLNNANFYKSRLDGAIFERCDLESSSFHKASINNCNFLSANLENTNFTSADCGFEGIKVSMGTSSSLDSDGNNFLAKPITSAFSLDSLRVQNRTWFFVQNNKSKKPHERVYSFSNHLKNYEVKKSGNWARSSESGDLIISDLFRLYKKSKIEQ